MRAGAVAQQQPGFVPHLRSREIQRPPVADAFARGDDAPLLGLSGEMPGEIDRHARTPMAGHAAPQAGERAHIVPAASAKTPPCRMLERLRCCGMISSEIFTKPSRHSSLLLPIKPWKSLGWVMVADVTQQRGLVNRNQTLTSCTAVSSSAKLGIWAVGAIFRPVSTLIWGALPCRWVTSTARMTSKYFASSSTTPFSRAAIGAAIPVGQQHAQEGADHRAADHGAEHRRRVADMGHGADDAEHGRDDPQRRQPVRHAPAARGCCGGSQPSSSSIRGVNRSSIWCGSSAFMPTIRK